MPKQFGHTRLVFVVLALAASLTGCRTASNTLAKVPGFGWMGRSDERWAQYEPAPGLPRPSESTEPTDPSMPSGVSGIASNDSMRGSTSRSFDEAEKFAKALTDDRYDGSRYSNDDDSFESDGDSKYASAYGKFGPPQNSDKLAGSSKAKPQSGPYDIGDSSSDLASSDNKFTGSKYSSVDTKFAKNGYDLGYDSQPSSKPYPKLGDKNASSPYGYASASSSDSKPQSKSRFDSSRYAPSGLASKSTDATSSPRFAAPKNVSRKQPTDWQIPPRMRPKSSTQLHPMHPSKLTQRSAVSQIQRNPSSLLRRILLPLRRSNFKIL